MYGTWQRPTRTLKTNENVVRERQHTRNRFFLAGTEFCELGQGHGNHLLDTPWLRFCFFCCWFRLHAGPSLNTHERNIKSVSHSNLFLIFENISTKVITNLCFFSNNIWPGLPWFQCWTNIIRKNPDGIQNGLARDWVSRCQEFIQTGEKKTRKPVVNKSWELILEAILFTAQC